MYLWIGWEVYMRLQGGEYWLRRRQQGLRLYPESALDNEMKTIRTSLVEMSHKEPPVPGGISRYQT